MPPSRLSTPHGLKRCTRLSHHQRQFDSHHQRQFDRHLQAGRLTAHG